jgi:hypothetical protein
MADQDYEYDVAISFLAKDEELARQVHSRLAPQLNVFVFSKKQEEVAGSDGLVKFREVFRYESRLVVTLFRDGWGQTPWTRVEEGAITERFLAEGWDWLLFVSLGCGGDFPPWLPDTHIRLDFGHYGLDELCGAIKHRTERLGARIRTETPAEKAARVAQNDSRREERRRRLREEGHEAARNETQELFGLLSEAVDQIAQDNPGLGMRTGPRGLSECVVTTTCASLLVLPHLSRPSSGSSLSVREYLGPMILPQEAATRRYSVEPKHHKDHEYNFDYQDGIGWCWQEGRSDRDPFTTKQLADEAISLLLELYEKVSAGELKPPSPFD